MQRREFLALSLAPMAMRLQGTSVITNLEKEIIDLMRTSQIPGLSIALVQDGAISWRRGFGVKDIRSKEPVDESTVFEAASTTKPVFAYAVMKLCEKGLLTLDTPLTKYTPERPLKDDARLDLITARHVLSHTTGFPNWRSKQQPMAIGFSPGEKWGYSGEGYSYLQAVVSRLTGASVNPKDCARFEAGVEFCAVEPSIDEHFQRNVFGPFGMTSSGLVWSDRTERNIAWGHDPKGQPLKGSRKPSGPAVARYAAAGGMTTTPSDYARFLIEVVAPKPPDAFRLAPASLAEMLRPQMKRSVQSSWALGWEINHTATGDFISHGGGHPGYSCFVAASPARKSGYVIMTNSEEKGFYEVISRLIAGDALPRFLGGKLSAG